MIRKGRLTPRTYGHKAQRQLQTSNRENQGWSPSLQETLLFLNFESGDQPTTLPIVSGCKLLRRCCCCRCLLWLAQHLDFLEAEETALCGTDTDTLDQGCLSYIKLRISDCFFSAVLLLPPQGVGGGGEVSCADSHRTRNRGECSQIQGTELAAGEN